jgi:hypothetical protein
MNKKHRGARNEMLACAYLLGEGFEVYRNVSAHGAIDLVAIKDNQTYYFDAKSIAPNESGNINRQFCLTEEQLRRNVIPLFIFPDGSCEIYWAATKLENNPKTFRCERCGKQTPRTTAWQKYCSQNCKVRAHHFRHGYVPKRPRQPDANAPELTADAVNLTYR